MLERKKLQPWVQELGQHPDFVVWKVEDKYVAGLPDTVIKRQSTGGVVWVELKWCGNKTTRAFKTGLRPEQYAHLQAWGDGAYLLLVHGGAGRAWLVPHHACPPPDRRVTPDDLDGSTGVRSAEASAPGVRSLLVAAL